VEARVRMKEMESSLLDLLFLRVPLSVITLLSWEKILLSKFDAFGRTEGDRLGSGRKQERQRKNLVSGRFLEFMKLDLLLYTPFN